MVFGVIWFTLDIYPTHTQATKKKSKRKAAGGAWRACLKLYSGSVGMPDNKHMASIYNTWKQENSVEYQHLERLGKAGTMAARCTKRLPGQTSFGFAKQFLKRSAEQASLQQLYNNIAGKSVTEQAHAIHLFVGRQDGGLAKATRVAQACQRLNNVAKKGTKEEEAAILTEWNQDIGQKQLESLHTNVPAMSGVPLKPIPGGNLMLFEVDPSFSVDRAVQATSWAQENWKKSTLSADLSIAWEDYHKLLDAEACHHLLPAENPHMKKPHSKCAALGTCVCSPQGMLWQRALNRLKEIMKDTFKPKEWKKKLANGMIVACVTSNEKLAMTDWQAGAESKAVVVLGIPLMYFQPYRPTFEVLLPAVAEPGVYQDVSCRPYVQVLWASLLTPRDSLLCFQHLKYKSKQNLGNTLTMHIVVLPL
eukprot:6492285-Amphidinium_carterae.2